MRRPNQEANVHRTVTEESVSPSVDINTANELKAGIVVLKSKLVCVCGGRGGEEGHVRHKISIQALLTA